MSPSSGTALHGQGTQRDKQDANPSWRGLLLQAPFIGGGSKSTPRALTLHPVFHPVLHPVLLGLHSNPNLLSSPPGLSAPPQAPGLRGSAPAGHTGGTGGCIWGFAPQSPPRGTPGSPGLDPEVWKGSPGSGLCLPGHGGHGQGFVAALATARHQGCSQGPISHLLSQLLKVPFASLCQQPGEAAGPLSQPCLHSPQGDRAWQCHGRKGSARRGCHS